MKSNVKAVLKKSKMLVKTKRMIGCCMREVVKYFNRMGSKKKCYMCGEEFRKFLKFRGGSRNINSFRKRLDGVGSDVDNFKCMFCGCNDRERHLCMYFDKLMIWDLVRGGKILHFAPEAQLSNRIEKHGPLEYIKADLRPKGSDVKAIDATAIPYDDGTFDFLIANHILEHIPNYEKALFEFYRVVKPGGVVVLQTPYSKILYNNFEDEGIDSDELRLFFHGQEDHVRTFGESQFLKSISDSGFCLDIKNHEDCFESGTARYYGVPVKEDLIMARK